MLELIYAVDTTQLFTTPKLAFQLTEQTHPVNWAEHHRTPQNSHCRTVQGRTGKNVFSVKLSENINQTWAESAQSNIKRQTGRKAQ